MLTVADTLSADHVRLGLQAGSPGEAITIVAGLLEDDVRVLDWDAFFDELRGHPPCRVGDAGDFGICIPHARTNAVSGMVMSAARLASDMQFPKCAQPVRYIFCFGVPQEMAADYLRVVGALMRLFTDAESEAAVRAATTGAEFIAALSKLEMKL